MISTDEQMAKMFKDLMGIRDVLRTGWVQMGIPEPENVMEHIYSCWLMALTQLDGESSEGRYDKNRVMCMLAIHDLGEVYTGDIPTPVKDQDTRYDIEEDDIMSRLFSNDIYQTGIDFYEQCRLWREWQAQITLESKIAYDIDKIQSVYQFCEYSRIHKGLFSVETKLHWLSKYYRLKTEAGRSIYSRLVRTHSEFISDNRGN